MILRYFYILCPVQEDVVSDSISRKISLFHNISRETTSVFSDFRNVVHSIPAPAFRIYNHLLRKVREYQQLKGAQSTKNLPPEHRHRQA